MRRDPSVLGRGAAGRRVARTELVVLVTLLAVAALAACESPTLPLPPPELPMQTVGADADHVTLSANCGGAEPNAIIVIINENPALRGDQAVSGAIANDCGRWDASVFAHKGDVLDLTQMSGSVTSLPTLVQIR